MNADFKQILEDINYGSEDLDDVDYSKLEDDGKRWGIGDKITWCYRDDAKYYWDMNPDIIKNEKDFVEYIKNNPPYAGVLFTFPDKRFDIYENAVVCCYYWPVEKENPDVFWVSLARLLNNKDLYKIYKID